MHTYIIVLKIEDMRVGGLYNHELHCTAFLWFSSTSEREEVIACVKQVARQFTGIRLTPAGTADFGSAESSLEVTLVEKTRTISKLHNELFRHLQRLHNFKLLQPEFTGSAWRPHVTTQNGNKFTAPVISNSLYLVEAQGDPKHDPKDVFAEVKLGV